MFEFRQNIIKVESCFKSVSFVLIRWLKKRKKWNWIGRAKEKNSFLKKVKIKKKTKKTFFPENWSLIKKCCLDKCKQWSIVHAALLLIVVKVIVKHVQQGTWIKRIYYLWWHSTVFSQWCSFGDGKWKWWYNRCF